LYCRDGKEWENRMIGEDFESKVKSLIDASPLKNYALHNVHLSNEDGWTQIDHLIILPNKLIILEDKVKTNESVRVTPSFDALQNYQKETYSVPNGKGIVVQVAWQKEVVSAILEEATTSLTFKADFNAPLHHCMSYYIENFKSIEHIRLMVLDNLKFTVEVVSLIDCKQITSYQTDITIVNVEGLKHYFDYLSSYLALYNETVIEALYADKIRVLEKYDSENRRKRELES
jgi:hypothetical protein